MQNSKDLFFSKTFIGALVAMVGTFLSANGIEIGDQGEIVNQIMAFGGMVFAVYGRVVAKDEVKSVAGVKVKE